MWRADPDIPEQEQRWARRVTVASTVLFLLVLCRWRPWTLFERAGFSNDFYDAQAHAFWNLRLAVPAEVAGMEGFLIDGSTYLYYGPLLAIARMPVALFGGWADGRLTRISMVVGFVCLCTVTFHLARRAGRLAGAAPGAPWRPALLVAAVGLSPALALTGWTSVYHETELWACVFLLGTIVALMDLHRAPSRRAAALAGAAAIATVLTRASMGFGALAALALTGLLLWRRDRRLALLAGGLAASGVLASVALNLAKFGTLLDLPADRQVLTLQNPDRAAWFAGNGGSFFGLRFLPTTVVQYLRPDSIRFERLAPFARFGPPAHEFGSYPLETNTPSSSLTAAATLLSLLAAVGVVMIIRRRWWVLWPLLAGAAIGAVPTLLIGFVANRYLADLLPVLIVPASAAVASLRFPKRHTVAVVSIVALAFWGIVVNVALATWQQNLKNPGFTAWRYQLDELVFGGAPPSVIDLDPAAAVPRDGVVAIDGACDGLYIAEQGRWAVLERADGVRRLRGTFDPIAADLVVEGGSGALSLVRASDGASLTAIYEPVGGQPVVGEPIDWDGDPVGLDVTSDPVAGGFAVTVDGRLALFAFAGPDLGATTPSAAFLVESPSDRGVPVCAELAARREAGRSLNPHGSS